MPRPLVFELVYDQSSPGAVQSRARAEAAVLADLGAEVLVVSDSDDVRTRDRGLALRMLRHLRRLPGPLHEVMGMAIVYARLRRAALQRPPDAIVYHSSTLAWPAQAVAARTGAETVFVVHSLMLDKVGTAANSYGRLRTHLYLLANRRALRSERVIGVSRYMSGVAVTYGASEQGTYTVPNAAPAADPPDDPVFATDLLYVGRLSFEKGPDLLLDALALLPETTTLTIVGEGKLRSALEKRARALPHTVRFLGQLEKSEVKNIMRSARLLVAPSRYEAQGVAVLEALACGTPVVASAVGGLSESVIDGYNGWLVEPSDPGALSTCVRQALTSKTLENSARDAARHSVGAFSDERFAREVGRCYGVRPGAESAADHTERRE